jgi:hypothetical protein
MTTHHCLSDLDMQLPSPPVPAGAYVLAKLSRTLPPVRETLRMRSKVEA